MLGNPRILANLRSATSHGKLVTMKRHALRIAVLLWLGWYLSGPIAATFDFWDPPREEMHDVQRNAGGLVTFLALVACFGIAAVRKLRQRSRYLATVAASLSLALIFRLSASLLLAIPTSSHSPPLLPLRI
jgi:purine-cytosine permease-like protein